ncbi:MAG: hypothetical protein ACE5GL_08600 [Calditrichia bacterium]
MGVIRKILGPRSKYDRSLPYTYMARVPLLEGEKELYSHYFSDTICGLVEYLDKNNIEPDEVELFGVYLKKEIPLEKEYCLSAEGRWLRRPEICRSLEEHYKQTLEHRYKGHVEKEICDFDDRDRSGDGPY